MHRVCSPASGLGWAAEGARGAEVEGPLAMEPPSFFDLDQRKMNRNDSKVNKT